jgi:transposase
MKKLDEKVYKNALITEKLVKLDKKERQKIIVKLLDNKSERQLSEEIGIPHSTIHDWKTLRQDNTGENIHISLCSIYRKLSNLKVEEITDWGRLEQIKNVIENLLRKK